MAECSSVLFVYEDGTAMHFYMRPCAERPNIKALVQAGGGTLSSKADSNSIKLTEDPDSVKSDEYYLPSYVTDCVQENQLLDLNSYKVMPGLSRLRHGSSDSDIFVSPESNQIHLHGEAKERKGRNKYLFSEDLNILTYILNEERYGDFSGNAIWKKMATLEITKHPWQSMKDRFRRHIIQSLDQYPIRDTKKLTKLKEALGFDTATSPDVLYSNKLTSNVWLSTREVDQSPIKNSPNRKTYAENNKDDDEIDDFDKKLLNMASQELPNTRSRSRSVSPRKAPHTSSKVKISKLESSTESSTEEDSDYAFTKRSTRKIAGKNNNKAKSSPLKSSTASLMKQKKDTMNKSPSTKQSANTPPPINLSPSGKGPKTPVNLCKQVTKRKLESEEGKAEDIDTSIEEGSEIEDGMALVDFVMRDTQSEVGSNAGSSQDVRKKRLRQTPKKSKKHPQFQLKVTLNGCDTELDEDDTCNVDDGAGSSIHRRIQPTRSRRNRISSVSSAENESITEGSYATAREEITSADECVEKSDSEEIEQTASLIKNISKWLDLDVENFLVAMHLNNGSIDETVRWLLYGRNSKGEKAWTEANDELLLKDNKNSTLAGIYSKDAMKKRKQYLISSRIVSS